MVSDRELERITERMEEDIRIDEDMSDTQIRKKIRSVKTQQGKNKVSGNLEDKIVKAIGGKRDVQGINEKAFQLMRKKGMEFSEGMKTTQFKWKGKPALSVRDRRGRFVTWGLR